MVGVASMLNVDFGDCGWRCGVIDVSSLEGHLWRNLEAGGGGSGATLAVGTAQCRPLPRPGSTAGGALQSGHAVLGRERNPNKLDDKLRKTVS